MRTTALIAGALVAVLGTGTPPVRARAATAPHDSIAVVPPEALAGTTVTAIEIRGLQRTLPQVVLRELAVEVGQPLDPAVAAADRAALERLRIFAEVEVGARRHGPGAAYLVSVEEEPAFGLSPALNVTQENGLSVGGGVAADNLGGQAVHGELQVLFGGIQMTYLETRSRWLAGRRGSYELFYFNRQRRDDLLDFYEVGNEVFATVAPRVGEHLAAGLVAGYQSLRADEPGPTLDDDRQDDVNTFGAVLLHDSRDRLVAPGSGWRNEARLVRTGLLGGESRFWRATLDVRRYLGLAPDHTLALSALLTLTSGRVGRQVAPWQVFYLGGTNTVRGWPTGSRTGKNQLLGTGEYRWAFRSIRPLALPLGWAPALGLQAAVFADLGLAWDDDPALDRAIDGYGIGLRLVTAGGGYLRLDLALAGGDGTVRLHLGANEKVEAQRLRVR